MHIWWQFGDFSSNLLQVMARTNQISRNSESKLQKWLWKSRSMILFSIPVESIPVCIFGLNVVIPAQICDDSSCGQCQVYWQTDIQTDGRTQATTLLLWPDIIWANARLLSIGALKTNFREFQSKCEDFHSRKCIWKCRLQFCLGLSVLRVVVEEERYILSYPLCILPTFLISDEQLQNRFTVIGKPSECRHLKMGNDSDLTI